MTVKIGWWGVEAVLRHITGTESRWQLYKASATI